ncbi:MAG: class I SAM-dependent methyltransferase [Oscillospiraceae bacterium]|nr:class I SAM-dependent methyltransferase [Oscillospiraceae bacterium]
MTNESKTLYIPLYAKAMMSREGFLEDKTAEQIVDSCGYDFEDVDKSRKLAIFLAMRALQYDQMTEKFIEKCPDCIVLHLGCGLDSRCKRVKIGAKKWYDIDFPEVIELRRKYFEPNAVYRMISSSVTDLSWLDEIDYHGENVLVIAEGLSMYLTLDEMTTLISEFGRRFSKTAFLFDAYSDAAARLSKLKNPVNKMDAQIHFSMSDPAVLEYRVKNAKCVINKSIIQKRYIDKLSGAMKARYTFMGGFGSGFYRIYGFRIKGENK